ncbi:hypothetical protein HanIR_Chr07g0323341 [Helianthus annuus]|nr:hypothetical protein HanIR_Chr07g0323341 [Helianthus annuus]
MDIEQVHVSLVFYASCFSILFPLLHSTTCVQVCCFQATQHDMTAATNQKPTPLIN